MSFSAYSEFMKISKVKSFHFEDIEKRRLFVETLKKLIKIIEQCEVSTSFFGIFSRLSTFGVEYRTFEVRFGNLNAVRMFSMLFVLYFRKCNRKLSEDYPKTVEEIKEFVQNDEGRNVFSTLSQQTLNDIILLTAVFKNRESFEMTPDDIIFLAKIRKFL